MGIEIYECPRDLPERIPQVLRERGYSVAHGPRHDEFSAKFTHGYVYEIRDGKLALHITGSEEDGVSHFFVTWHGWWSVILPRRAKHLQKGVTAVLLENGAKLHEPKEPESEQEH